jgi:TatD DNase family protein
MLIDTHAHIHDPSLASDPGVLDRARAAGVTRIVTVGCDEKTTADALALAALQADVWAVAGIHPHEADRYLADPRLDWLRAALAAPRTVAIGEIGLDYAKMHSSKAGQQELFRRQLRLALELSKPVVIHCRDAYDDCKRLLREEMKPPVRGVMHCFSGTVGDARDFLDLGFVISIAGPVTFANADGLRQVARAVPLDRLVVETDCPYLTPVPHRGKRNEPAFVRHTAEQVAKCQNVPFEEFARVSTATAMNLFSLA